jgi:hypothetical protein
LLKVKFDVSVVSEQSVKQPFLFRLNQPSPDTQKLWRDAQRIESSREGDGSRQNFSAKSSRVTEKPYVKHSFSSAWNQSSQLVHQLRQTFNDLLVVVRENSNQPLQLFLVTFLPPRLFAPPKSQ